MKWIFSVLSIGDKNSFDEFKSHTYHEFVNQCLFLNYEGCEKGYHSSCLSAGILDAAKMDSKGYNRSVIDA